MAGPLASVLLHNRHERKEKGWSFSYREGVIVANYVHRKMLI